MANLAKLFDYTLITLLLRFLYTFYYTFTTLFVRFLVHFHYTFCILFVHFYYHFYYTFYYTFVRFLVHFDYTFWYTPTIEGDDDENKWGKKKMMEMDGGEGVNDGNGWERRRG